ncbi:lanthionine synthetase LanC family protein (plasmid) [Streptomyces sp. BI20]|uniref:lanthionine synthetase LanC family protein n=1 Tax=Streptomyces sp. BI20 TaxID=3403460 RepID=UPI003C720C55
MSRTPTASPPLPHRPHADTEARTRVEAAVRTVLTHWLDAPPPTTGTPADAADPTDRPAAPGAGPAPVVLALLLPESDRDLVAESLRTWLRRLPAPPPRHAGALTDGLAARLAGLRLAARRAPALGPLADRLDAALDTAARAGHWSGSRRVFTDYDLIGGPAGVLLARAVAPPARPATPDPPRDPVTAHLLRLCARPDLADLRLTGHADHPLNGWCHGRINTGLGHGVAGVVAALASVVHRTPDDTEAAGALARAAGWLAARAEPGPDGAGPDGAGPITWPIADGTPPARSGRRAWCYGTPGIAWALRDAADALAHAGLPVPGLRELADTAFASVARDPDPASRFPVIEDGADGAHLTVCHGAAGVLGLADAFTRAAPAPDTPPGPASALRDRLRAHLLDHLDALVTLGRRDLTLPTGAAGALTVLATSLNADRTPLPLLALR